MLQTRDQPKYAGFNLLVTVEEALKNYNRWIVETIIRGAKLSGESARVLDFGAGIGTLSMLFQSITRIRPEAIEPDPALTEILQSRGFTTYATISGTPGYFDLIFSSNVLEHIADDQAVLTELRAKLNPAGVLAIYVPAFPQLWSSVDDAVGHQRRYTKVDLAAKLKATGFVTLDMRYCDAAGYFATLLFKLLAGRQTEPSARALQFFDRFIWPVSTAVDCLTHPYFGKNLIAFAGPRPERLRGMEQ